MMNQLSRRDLLVGSAVYGSSITPVWGNEV